MNPSDTSRATPSGSEDPIKVLYVMGRGRSGSTIFANVLGEHDRFFSAGEIRYLWDPVLKNHAACACGEPLPSCPVWSKVLGQLEDIPLEEAARWQREVVSERNLWRLLRYPGDGSWHSLEAFASVMTRVYRALAEATGASVIVDSSKRPSYAALVRLLEECDLYCIQMVRDPRASAYSWGHRRHDSVFGAGKEVKRRNALDSTVRWNVLNMEAEVLLRRLSSGRKMRLRYEDFVAAPRTTTTRVTQFVGEAGGKSPFTDQRTVKLSPNHTIAGNPSRFSTGELVVQDTGEWRVRQSAADRRIATAIALPYLRRYGYPLRTPNSIPD